MDLSRPLRRAVVLGVLAACAAAPAAEAHVQVRPAQAAPGDPVLWTVLVPNERDEVTTRVELAIPEGVLPFAYEPLPGWTRRVTKNADQSTRSVVWTGRLEPEEVLATQFLATTPDTEGPISWKAIQTYADGQKVRWIGGPDTEEPASVTQVTASAPRENAGGEAAAAEAAPAKAASSPDGEDGGGDGLAIAALVVGVLALVASGVALLSARGRRD